MTVGELFRSLPTRLRPERAEGWTATFHFVLKGGEPPHWTVCVTKGTCTVVEGLEGEADCVVRMRAATYLGIERGEINAQTAFLTGRVKVSNLVQMMRYIKAFRPAIRKGPDRGPAAAKAPERPGRETAEAEPERDLPLSGLVVLDLSRLLPGAVVARQLIDLGARLIKIEDPATGDPLRHAPPLVDGVGAAFAAFFRGAESVCLDLSTSGDARRLRALAGRADVLVESFRPGTLASWGLAPQQLAEINPRLVVCSLPAFGSNAAVADRVAHDLNLSAESGLLSLLGGGFPALQIADVGSGLLAVSAILAALLRREHSGRGAVLEQPLLSGTLPFLTWVWADHAAGGTASLVTAALAGRVPAYRIYSCRDGRGLAVAALEPKFWVDLVQRLGLPQHAGAGLDSDEAGDAAAADLERVFASAPRDHWLAVGRDHRLPLSPVNDVAEASGSVELAATGLFAAVPEAGGVTLPGPYHPSLGRTPARTAPRLGGHTHKVLDELAALGSEELPE